MRRGRGRAHARRGPGIAGAPAAAVLAAGGIGERFRSSPQDRPKQLLELRGRPMYLWALDALLEAGCGPIVIPAPADWVDAVAQGVAGLDGVQVVPGGPTRQASVANGLAGISAERVVVHDAARPLATAAAVRRVIDRLESADAVLAAVPVDETLKRVTGGDVVEATVDRSNLWRSQTPAAFRTEVLKDAHRRAAREGFTGTDESQLVERYGGRVAVVEGSRFNIKVTWQEDLPLAEALLGARG